jgi:hypothetical protein
LSEGILPEPESSQMEKISFHSSFLVFPIV